MKWYECVRVAFWNMKAYKGSSIKIIIGLTTVVLLLFCSLAYKGAFEKRIINLENQYQMNCYLEKYVEYNDGATYEEELADLQEEKDVIGYSEASLLSEVSVMPKNEPMYIARAEMNIAGKKLKGKSEILAGITPERHMWSTDNIIIGDWEDGFSPFPEIVIKTYGSPYLYGREPINEKELIISDYLLGEFGLNKEEYSEIVGKNITLYIENGKYTAFKDYKVVGVFSASFLEEREKNTFYNSSVQHIYAKMDLKTKARYFPRGGMIRLYVSNYEHLAASGEKARAIDKEIHLSTYGRIYETMSKQVSLFNKIFDYIIWGFIFATTAYLVCILYFFFKQNQDYTMILKAIGINKSCIYIVVATQLFIFCFLALVLGVYIGMFILYALKYIYEYAMILEFEFGVEILVQSALISIFYCIVLCAVGEIVYMSTLRKKNVAESLRAEK